VYVNGEELAPSFPHSWGSNDCGCKLLALRLLHYLFGLEYALTFFDEFTRDVVAQLPQEDFRVELDLGE